MTKTQIEALEWIVANEKDAPGGIYIRNARTARCLIAAGLIIRVNRSGWFGLPTDAGRAIIAALPPERRTVIERRTT